MNDIVERLRVLSSQGDPTIENEAADRIVLLEGQLVVAADEIERLRAQRDSALVEAVGLRAAVTAMRAALMAREET